MWEILIASIWSKASDIPTCGFFDISLQILEVSEHFALMSHRVDPGVPGEVVDEEHVISASAECSRLCRSPYIGMDYVE